MLATNKVAPATSKVAVEMYVMSKCPIDINICHNQQMLWRMKGGNPTGVIHSMPLEVQHGKQSVDSHGYKRPDEWNEILILDTRRRKWRR